MTGDVGADQLVQIQVQGMHCHQCESRIQKALSQIAGIHEVEVDFNSGLVSILVERSTGTAKQMIEAITAAGYQANSFTQRQADRLGHHP